MRRTNLETDVLVLGAGIAGLCVALNASERRVLVVCPDEPVRSSSSALAQGGIAAPIGASDSVAAHILDTIEAAAHFADPATVSRVIGDAAQAVHYLIDSGVPFDRDGAQLSLHREAGHGAARVVHAAGDRTGEAIVRALWQRAQAAGHIEFLGNARAVELLVLRGHICGARLLSPRGPIAIHARDTVLATGGIGRMFRMTTNGPFATGDGLAMALDAGARTAALEFVQFHPTALYVQADPLPLLTEALRGAGARLITAGGRPVMAGRHPLGDLAPRDVVSRAVWECQQAGEIVLLDATSVFNSPQAASFPGALETARRYGFEPSRQPLPVTAAAHFHMGGIAVNDHGASSLPGLWAGGEVACTGLHGANRLASNSLLEAVVYGRAIGTALNLGSTPAVSGTPDAATEAAHDPEHDPRWTALRELMWHSMGPVRDGASLRSAIAQVSTEIEGCQLGDAVLRRRLLLARAMMQSALARSESRGAHWRRDYPQRDPQQDAPSSATA
ncbi:MAG: L-aspartate oxidase [Proteobacteria bacterium]|nr:L-aspartate oxidase [Pseudomonadota bacterium]